MKAKITVGVVLAAIVIAAVLIFFPRKTAPEVRFGQIVERALAS
jgi:hypothetical protein